MTRYFRLLCAITFIITSFQCSFLTEMMSTKKGAVRFYNSIPPSCDHSRGLKQKVIKPVYSEKEMLAHYGISFQIRFQDKISPELYGVLYYQNKDSNVYCMVLPDGRFAMFSNSRIDNKDNIIQEVCYPLKKCNL